MFSSGFYSKHRVKFKFAPIGVELSRTELRHVLALALGDLVPR